MAPEQRAGPLIRSLVTPEGVDLRLQLGAASERAVAFLIDVTIIVIALVALSVFAGLFVVTSGLLNVTGIVWIGGAFVLRNFYFVLFELRPRAATPGKRLLGLRVISQGGGRLTADAVLARNLMRELELFLPLSFLASQGRGAEAWITIAGLAWSGVFALFPLFNRDRMRVGDLIAGTWVVHVPTRKLMADLAAERAHTGLAFTKAQVEAYGVRELQTLEHVLRMGDREAIKTVAGRIRRKIGWAGTEDDQMFLDAFYAALRHRLEARLLYGHRKRDKFDMG